MNIRILSAPRAVKHEIKAGIAVVGIAFSPTRQATAFQAIL
jgi:hypothetical protein